MIFNELQPGDGFTMDNGAYEVAIKGQRALVCIVYDDDFTPRIDPDTGEPVTTAFSDMRINRTGEILFKLIDML